MRKGCENDAKNIAMHCDTETTFDYWGTMTPSLLFDYGTE